MAVNKRFGPYALQLYLYLAKNADGYTFALSPQAAENEAGITKTTFHKYINLFIAEGYLVQRGGNTYDFYESPRKQQEEKQKMGEPWGGQPCSQDEPQNFPGGRRNSQGTANHPQGNIEIDNRYTNKTDKETDSLRPQEARGEMYPVREVHIRPPERKSNRY